MTVNKFLGSALDYPLRLKTRKNSFLRLFSLKDITKIRLLPPTECKNVAQFKSFLQER